MTWTPIPMLLNRPRTLRQAAGESFSYPISWGEQAPIWDSDARGVFIGLAASTTRGDMVRAIMEGIALGIRQNFQVFIDDGWTVGDVRNPGRSGP